MISFTLKRSSPSLLHLHGWTPTQKLFSLKHVRSIIDQFSLSTCRYSTLNSETNFCDERIKLITFDVTGTLLTFHKPPFEIYAEFGERHGLRCSIDDDPADKEKLKSAFYAEWKRLNKQQPHFGSCWESWWTQMVIGTFQGAKVEGSQDHPRMTKLATDLISHFSTASCWKLKPGAVELITSLQNSISLQQQQQSNTNTKVKVNKATNLLCGLGIISNFDPRLHILLKLFQLESTFSPIILSHEQQISKPSPEIFNLALEEFRKEGGRNKTSSDATSAAKLIEIQPEEALHVGDNYDLDYVGAINAGWKACLIGKLPAEHQGSISRGGGGGINFPDLKAFHDFLKEKGTVSA